MKKYIILITMCFVLSGCSLIPRITFDSKGSTPQQTEKSTVKDVCKGESKFNEMGEMVYCSKGYSAYAKNYEKKERKFTIAERVGNFINNILGWGIPGLFIICVLFPGAFTIIGAIIGRLFEGAFGMAKKALSSTVRAVQKIRKNGGDIDTVLAMEQDEDVEKFIKKLKDEKKIK